MNFSKEGVIFWGIVTLLLKLGTEYLKYKRAKLAQKETQMDEQKLGDENIKKVLGGINAAGGEIAKLAKDGIQVKDAAQLVEDILASPELRAQISNIVACFPQALLEAKDIDILEGIDVAKFEYEGIKSVLDELKK